MSRLSEMLRDAATGDVEDLELDVEDLRRRVETRRRNRSRAKVAGGLVVAVLLAGALALAAGPDDHGTQVATDGPRSEPGPTSSEPGPTNEGGAEVRLAGTYGGRAITVPGVDGCADLSATYRFDVAMDDGSRWALDQDACGTFVDDAWQSDGTFTLTAPDGATLSGTFAIDASPPDGSPYTLVVTDGSRRFAGATGSCDLTAEVTTVSSSEHRHDGDITCRIDLRES